MLFVNISLILQYKFLYIRTNKSMVMFSNVLIPVSEVIDEKIDLSNDQEISKRHQKQRLPRPLRIIFVDGNTDEPYIEKQYKAVFRKYWHSYWRIQLLNLTWEELSL